MSSKTTITRSLVATLVFICALHGHFGFSQCQHVAQTHIHAEKQYNRNNVTALCPISNGNDTNAMSDASGVTTALDSCTCGPEANPPPGARTPRYQIACQNRHFANQFFSIDTLSPSETQILSLAWNDFETVPKFMAVNLKILDLSNNKVKAIGDRDFENVITLVELNLSWNRIEQIATDAFVGLDQLKRLDLSHNLLKNCAANIFKPLAILETLILSSNKQLNETLQQKDVNLFATLGVTKTLTRLELNEVNLNELNFSGGDGLKEVYLKYNRFNQTPVNLPANIELIDFSGNLFTELDQHFLPAQHELRELHMSRVLSLTTIAQHAFHNLTNLRVLNFDGCKNLRTFHENAFGALMSPANETNASMLPQHLERVNLRNAKLERLNLENVFKQLERLDLYGNPLICDCQLNWLKNLQLETYARCSQPEELKTKLLSNLPKKRLVCQFWPKFVYAIFHAILIVCMLAIGAIPIWILVLILKPSRRTRLQKIGASSPYARITIETNRAEDNYL